jgi:DNA repair protein RecO (recombination protein O)
MKHLATEAVVLSAVEVGEEDRIVTLLSRDAGLIRAGVSGARSLKKGLTASIDLFSRIDSEISLPGRSGGLARLKSARVIDPYMGIRSRYSATCAASYLSELYWRSLPEMDSVPGAFQALADSFSALASGKGIFRIILVSELLLLREQGLSPELERCLTCGERVDAGFLCPATGGVLHDRCTGGAEGVPLTAGDVANLRYLHARGFSPDARLTIREEPARVLFEKLHVHTVYQMGFEIRSLQSFRDL